jgi:hypothetical protein
VGGSGGGGVKGKTCVGGGGGGLGPTVAPLLIEAETTHTRGFTANNRTGPPPPPHSHLGEGGGGHEHVGTRRGSCAEISCRDNYTHFEYIQYIAYNAQVPK